MPVYRVGANELEVPSPFPYQGSKRSLLGVIGPFIPQSSRVIEPFAGSAAVSIAALLLGRTESVWLNDINSPLMSLWTQLIEDPSTLADQYEALWVAQKDNPGRFYARQRDYFNSTGDPAVLLYLLMRCVKGAVRYNARGEFNQSPDNRRLGRNPSRLRRDVTRLSDILKGRVLCTSADYTDILNAATPSDLVYLDPPYQGTSSKRDSRYLAGINREDLIDELSCLNRRRVPFVLSYDGRTGGKKFGAPLPTDLDLLRIPVVAGRSAQATLLGRDETTVESLYLSPALQDRLSAGDERMSLAS